MNFKNKHYLTFDDKVKIFHDLFKVAETYAFGLNDNDESYDHISEKVLIESLGLKHCIEFPIKQEKLSINMGFINPHKEINFYEPFTVLDISSANCNNKIEIMQTVGGETRIFWVAVSFCCEPAAKKRFFLRFPPQVLKT